MVRKEGPAGSFFHKVPDDDDKKESDDNPSIVDDEFSELLRKRKKPSRASKPSTINGIPTAQATGFGKAKPGKQRPSKPYTAVGPSGIEKRGIPNSVSHPETDDQGYTLYTDEKTGKKSRVFEALLHYPSDFTLKIVGANEGSFVSEIVALVAEACETEPAKIAHTARSIGKWTSVTCTCPVQSAEMVYAMYEAVDRDPRVKFKF
ncbi:unnamed protein product [Cylindrotheca closterium]|uniref:Uncharacterized protein n=1 Tax=Cylindrotheca closterium TaxID=2856 RepID=A0AAD2PU23_9STRA|nr:unnamed protein product [Cylindrotheca closterium]